MYMYVHCMCKQCANYMNSVQWSGNEGGGGGGGATLKVGGSGPPQLLTFPFEHSS